MDGYVRVDHRHSRQVMIMLPRYFLTAMAAVGLGLASCAADDVIININPDSGDSIEFSIPFDSLSETVDTIVVDGDTIILIVLDTVITPSDTVLVPVFDTILVVDTVLQVDTLVDTVDFVGTIIDAGTGDTTFVLIQDSIIVIGVDTAFIVVVDTLETTVFDTVIQFDTVFEERVDTTITVDTVLVVDTVWEPRPELGFGSDELELEIGESVTLKVTVLNALGQPVPAEALDWLSAAPSIATVSNVGRVTGVSEGSTDIFAIADGAGLSASITTSVADTASTTPPPPDTVVSPGELWFEEGWSYADTDDMKSDPNRWLSFKTWNAENAETFLATGIPGTPWGGGRALKVTYFVGSNPQDPEASTRIDFPRAVADQPGEFWMETYVKWDPFFKTDFGRGFTADHKTFFFWENTEDRRHEFKVGLFSRGMWARIGDRYEEVAQFPASGGSGHPDQYSESNQLIPEDEVWDGVWHRLRFHIRLDTDGTDGEWEVWLDDMKVVDGQGIDLASASSGSTHWTGVTLAANLNEGPDVEAQSIWFGPVRVWIGDPGWQ